jgi:hypothetical protein
MDVALGQATASSRKRTKTLTESLGAFATQSTYIKNPRVESIAEAARELDRLRRNWLNPEGASEVELKKRTLTNLYNDRPTWLQNAHDKLDKAVFAVYGWPPNLPDEDVLKNLLTLNKERAEEEKVWRLDAEVGRSLS